MQLTLIGMSLALEVFDHEPKYWKNLNFDIMNALNDLDHHNYYSSQTAVGNFMAIHPTVVEIFQTGPSQTDTCCWRDENISIYIYFLYGSCVLLCKQQFYLFHSFSRP